MPFSSLKRGLISTLLQLVYLAGRQLRDGGITILSYHSLDDFGTPLSVRPRLFSAHMAALASEPCVTFNMSQVADHLATGRPFPPRSVAITFDDGFANFAGEATKVLARYNFTATVYVISGMVGKVTRWTDHARPLPNLPLLSWEQVEALHAGGIEVGAHSVTHGFLTQYDSQALERELRESRAVLERRLQTLVSSFAYPQGDYDARVVAATRAAGYRSAVTVDQGRAHLSSDPWRLPRLLVSGNTSPARLRSFTVPSIGPAYSVVNFALRRLLRRERWPRRYPGEVDSSSTLPGQSILP